MKTTKTKTKAQPRTAGSLERVVRRWETAAGYEAMYRDEITDTKSLRDVLQRNQRWLEEHCEERIRQAGQVASSV